MRTLDQMKADYAHMVQMKLWDLSAILWTKIEEREEREERERETGANAWV